MRSLLPVYTTGMVAPTFTSSISAHLPAAAGRRALPWRWAVLLGLSLLLHWLVLGSLQGVMDPFGAAADSAAIPMRAAPVAEISLLPARSLPAEPMRAPAPKVRRPQQAPVPQADVASSTMTALTTEVASEEHGLAPAVLDPADADNDTFASETSSRQEQDRPAHPRYKAAPLPSAILKYDVEALRKGDMVYGSGKIDWQSDGQTYAVNGEAGVLFFTLLDFRSHGLIDEHGVSPVMYTQKRFRKSATNTHFHRERELISFSASTLSYPRLGGEQDRASLIWQLAAIGRADPEQFVAGEDLSFLVAGVRDLQNWQIKVMHQEEVETGEGRLTAWRVSRIPPASSYEQRLDIWLAPELGWYPVKLRHTDYNGEYLDMILSDLATFAD